MVPVLSGSNRPCAVCRRVHRDLTRVLGTSAPDDWLAVSAGERMEAELTPDVCILPDHGTTRHFIRGHIQLPVVDPDPDVFVWSVWTEVDESSMECIARNWSDPNRAASAPLSGRLATELPYEQPTRGLQLTIYTRDPGMAPLLMVSSGSQHPLAAEQRDGIALHRVAEFAELLAR
ncbi:MAG: DUF2199 domain-containing protein [Propionicimonas sp.]|uniref:DUF2199 domain-containing protein n=1 Tax=Propionicimonas sp. TaxID=1955623 RepID=UPI003D0A9935